MNIDLSPIIIDEAVRLYCTGRTPHRWSGIYATSRLVELRVSPGFVDLCHHTIQGATRCTGSRPTK